MKKVLFRDQPFYLKYFRHPRYEYSGSEMSVYVENTGFGRCFGKYKKVAGKCNLERKQLSNKSIMIKLLEEAYIKVFGEVKVIECIQCTPQIEALYKQPNYENPEI